VGKWNAIGNKFGVASRKVAEFSERSDESSKTWSGATPNLAALALILKEHLMNQDL